MSDVAFTGLVKQARDVGYIRGSERAKGLAMYMQYIVQNNPEPHQWGDNRPRHIQEDSILELESGLFATWDTGELRTARVFSSVIMDTIDDHVQWLAKEIGCIKQTRRRLTRQALISQFWEAVGLGWLVPSVLPSKSYHTSKPRREKYELNF